MSGSHPPFSIWLPSCTWLSESLIFSESHAAWFWSLSRGAGALDQWRECELDLFRALQPPCFCELIPRASPETGSEFFQPGAPPQAERSEEGFVYLPPLVWCRRQAARVKNLLVFVEAANALDSFVHLSPVFEACFHIYVSGASAVICTRAESHPLLRGSRLRGTRRCTSPPARCRNWRDIRRTRP